MISDELYKLMRLLEINPEVSQRELAHQLGISLGKVNYCVKELIAKGWVKAKHFTNSRNKSAYAYLLTPQGIDEKTRLTMAFLKAKMQEYETLRAEIRQMRKEVCVALPDQREALMRGTRD